MGLFCLVPLFAATLPTGLSSNRLKGTLTELPAAYVPDGKPPRSRLREDILPWQCIQHIPIALSILHHHSTFFHLQNFHQSYFLPLIQRWYLWWISLNSCRYQHQKCFHPGSWKLDPKHPLNQLADWQNIKLFGYSSQQSGCKIMVMWSHVCALYWLHVADSGPEICSSLAGEHSGALSSFLPILSIHWHWACGVVGCIFFILFFFLELFHWQQLPAVTENDTESSEHEPRQWNWWPSN